MVFFLTNEKDDWFSINFNFFNYILYFLDNFILLFLMLVSVLGLNIGSSIWFIELREHDGYLLKFTFYINFIEKRKSNFLTKKKYS